MPRQLPVTVLSGLPEVGKTTLLRQIIGKQDGHKIAVIVNGLMPIDPATDRWDGVAKFVRLDMGCACCSANEELIEAVASLARTGEYDYLFIESGGASEPLGIAETFAYVDEDGQCLHDLARLDTMVTVVNAKTFMVDFHSSDELFDRGIAVDEADDRNIVDLLVDQVEFADVIVITNVDRVKKSEVAALESLLTRLNPEAHLLRASPENLDVSELMDTGRFDPEKVSEGPEWQRSIRAVERSSPDDHGFSSLVFKARRPVHPDRFYEFVQAAALDGVVRSKGFVWLASRHDWVGLWSQAGKVCGLSGAGSWWATASEDEWPESPQARAEIVEGFDPEFGDRRQEVIFIGQNIDPDLVRRGFEACLLTDAEMALGPELWAEFDDPWPSWDDDDGMFSHEDDDDDDEFTD